MKAKLGMNLPLIMHGASLLYEVGDDLDDIMVANYNANLEKVRSQIVLLFALQTQARILRFSHMIVFLFQSLSELPSPIVNGSILTVEDLQQELSCKINVKHRLVFF